jgi:hypothetical protein
MARRKEPMEKLQKLISAEMEKLPERLFERLIAGKLKAAGVPNPEAVAPKMLAHIKAGNTDEFVWHEEDGRPPEPRQHVAIHITDEDIAQVGKELDAFMKDDFPKVISETAEVTATGMVTSLRKGWKAQKEYQEAVITSFQYNLERRWGKAFDALRMVLTVAREIGDDQFKRVHKSKKASQSHKRQVLIRLHARACQVTGEIVTLIENGYADGAMARWRTLHEIGIVSTLIADFGDEMAERYIAHEIVEAKAAMDEYKKNQDVLGLEPYSKRQVHLIERQYALVMAQYGTAFGSPHGWAAKHLDLKKPHFGDLERAAGKSAMRSYYKMASYNVHAGPKGIFFKLGLIDPRAVILAGPTNSGFTEPAQNAALTLVAITSLLLNSDPTFDELVMLQTLVKLREGLPEAFLRIERKLRTEDARFRKSKAARKKAK